MRCRGPSREGQNRRWGRDWRDGESGEEREIKLGAWISNQRSRAATLSAERIEQLAAIGMRWT
ncbi:helicase associated domain-containing protein [Streptomyces sp. 1222.5]|uniref:helicase associated domain-containing protein n=1 Tax=Streptomyces sp. 1222.5 TaxID=1881026 RepID=UPI003D7024E0